MPKTITLWVSTATDGLPPPGPHLRLEEPGQYDTQNGYPYEHYTITITAPDSATDEDLQTRIRGLRVTGVNQTGAEDLEANFLFSPEQVLAFATLRYYGLSITG